MARIRGAKEHSQRLARMRGSGPERVVGQALFVGGETIADEAKGSIMRGAVSGKGHVPSKPGEPPKNDSQRLHDNIEVVQPRPLLVEVSSNAPYAAALEYGTSKMAARPYMKPATDKKRPEVVRLVRQAISHVVNRSGGR